MVKYGMISHPVAAGNCEILKKARKFWSKPMLKAPDAENRSVEVENEKQKQTPEHIRRNAEEGAVEMVHNVRCSCSSRSKPDVEVLRIVKKIAECGNRRPTDPKSGDP